MSVLTYVKKSKDKLCLNRGEKKVYQLQGNSMVVYKSKGNNIIQHDTIQFQVLLQTKILSTALWL